MRMLEAIREVFGDVVRGQVSRLIRRGQSRDDAVAYTAMTLAWMGLANLVSVVLLFWRPAERYWSLSFAAVAISFAIERAYRAVIPGFLSGSVLQGTRVRREALLSLGYGFGSLFVFVVVVVVAARFLS